MREHFDKVKLACDFAGVVSSEASVSVIGERIEASNHAMLASAPAVGIKDFSVPAVDLDHALRKLGDPSVSVTDAYVSLKGEGGTTRIKRIPSPKAPFERPDIPLQPVEDVEDLLGALSDVWPFGVGDPARPWSVGARFDGATITATNGVMLLQAKLKKPSPFKGAGLSRQAINYLRQRGSALVRWGYNERGFLFEFSDGSWMLAGRLNGEMPDSAVGLIDGAVAPGAWAELVPISDEDRAAFLSSISHTENILEIYPDHIYGVRLSSDHRCAIKSRLGKGVEKAMFTAKDLTTVFTVAAAIGLDCYPNPVPFVTKRGSRGLIAGRR